MAQAWASTVSPTDKSLMPQAKSVREWLLQFDAQAEKLVIPAMRRVFNNPPYRTYLAMKVPLTLFSLMPINMLTFFVRHNMALENYLGTQTNTLAAALAGSSSPLQTRSTT